MPSDVFYTVGRIVFTKLGILPTREKLEDFVANRIEAERLARQRISREEITLVEIWEVLLSSLGWTDKDLIKCEIEAEEQLLFPIAIMREQVLTSRKQGIRVVFTSDTYLPRSFVEKLLINRGFAEPGDGFYISSEIGKTKASGNLFKHLLQAEAVSPNKVQHVGDNVQSDYLVAKSCGIDAALCDYANATPYELRLLQLESCRGAAAEIVGAARAFRLQRHGLDNIPLKEMVGQFAGPFVMGFAVWLLKRARETGVKRLYFLSRDCQLIWKAASVLAPEFGGIECKYLYVSRQALFLPSAGAISPEEMTWMRRFFEEPRLDRLLAKLELTFDDVQGSLGAMAGEQKGAYCLKSESDWDLFWNALNQEPTKKRILDLISTRRQSALEYFRTAGLFDSVSWALVDIGWFLTCQHSLRKLLLAGGWTGQLQGFYLGLQQGRKGPAEAGTAEAMFYQRAPDVPHALQNSGIFSCATLLEHLIGCADHPTVHHYAAAGNVAQPVFGGTLKESEANLAAELHELTLSFVNENRSLVSTFSNSTTCRILLDVLVSNFVKFPSENMAKSIAALSAAFDQNNLDSMPIVKAFNFFNALTPMLPRRYPFLRFWKEMDCLWPEGSLAMTAPNVQYVLAASQFAARVRSKVWRTIRR
ncbi:hydrolase (HAD superfamily)-like protein [Pedosphaera parvula Ellin514]|uniref:Hydrolase (HAD superfamily)-like protein n=1 Tax=Pedosphaera parvula (strain Ellin514) TaxID=320771 RepID=B9XD33_PEDPL|nr:hydrolase (HAD superfamily)-like protein [Pedosphaera parvula Ellin514]